MVAFLSSPRMLAVAATMAAGLITGAGQVAAASQYVVIAAEGSVAETFPPGRVLVPGDRIEMASGSTLTLLGEDGTVTAIPGPAAIAVTEDSVESSDAGQEVDKNRSTLAKLASLIAGEQRNSNSLGVSRGIEDANKLSGLEDPWVLSISRSARGCVRNEPVRLGRNSDKGDLALVVKGDDIDSVTELQLKAGESVVSLPEKIPPTTQELLVKVGGKTIFLDLTVLPAEIDAADAMAVLGWMVDEGCDGQALAFARLMASEAGNQ